MADGSKDEFYGTLKQIYNDQLRQHDFLYIHASYLVNYDYISKIGRNELFLLNMDISLPISQSRRTEIKKAHYEIAKKRGV
jgi:DNA-binding LytR/AlgR family response regulator